jgi:hypothetical protein
MTAPRTWTIHTDAETVEWRRRVATHYPLVPSHRLLRLALRYGLRSAALHPELLVEEAACTDSERDTACTDSDKSDDRSGS